VAVLLLLEGLLLKVLLFLGAASVLEVVLVQVPVLRVREQVLSELLLRELALVLRVVSRASIHKWLLVAVVYGLPGVHSVLDQLVEDVEHVFVHFRRTGVALQK